MPQAAANKKLSGRQIALVKKWIEQGAEYKGHWAYVKPVRPAVPAAEEADFVRNPVDQFILAKLREVGLQHAPEADRVTLIRRLSFDLTGLPPTRVEVEAFLADQAPDAYEKVVDRLLASPHYGERMAMYWLDLVRYADSIGYHSDNPMNVSPYRDHVIKVFNDNQHFDRFTVEQLAGDLLPGSTLDQKVASAYNRLLQTTAEGGMPSRGSTTSPSTRPTGCGMSRRSGSARPWVAASATTTSSTRSRCATSTPWLPSSPTCVSRRSADASRACSCRRPAQAAGAARNSSDDLLAAKARHAR